MQSDRADGDGYAEATSRICIDGSGLPRIDCAAAKQRWQSRYGNGMPATVLLQNQRGEAGDIISAQRLRRQCTDLLSHHLEQVTCCNQQLILKHSTSGK
jgi:hypothetical protein